MKATRCLGVLFLLFAFQSVDAQESCRPGPATLCLNGGRFRVDLQWTTSDGARGPGQPVPLTADTGYFWFFDDQNVEVIVKVLDACSLSGGHWVFAAGLTDAGVTMTVTDTASGAQKVYRNPQGTPFQPIQDTAAFSCSGATAIGSPAALEAKQLPATLLLDNRFAVDVAWKTAQGMNGAGHGVALTNNTGYFWFFDQRNIEVVVKVLNACDPGDRFWVFASGLTDVEVMVTVTDMVTGAARTYTNAQGKAFQPLQDTNAFATCLPDVALAVPTNPDDPLLLRATSPAGDRVEYFGVKDASGFATDVTAIDVAFANGDGVIIELDDRKRPVRALTRSGVPIEIEWLTDSRIVFTATSPDGAEQVTVTVDLSQPAPKAVVSRMTAPVRRRARGIPDVFMSPDRMRLELAGSASWTPAGGAAGESIVSVRHCEAPVNNALVRMSVLPNFGLAYTLPGLQIGNGQYRVLIPSAPSETTQQVSAICETVVEALDPVCAGIEGLGAQGGAMVCARVAAAAAALNPAAGLPIVASCAVTFGAVSLYCETLGKSLAPRAPSPAEVLCKTVPGLFDRATSQELTLVASATIPAAGTFTAPLRHAPGRGPFPNFQIDAGQEPRIGRFVATPPDPAPGQGYFVTVEFHCAPPSTQVVLSIAGSDGYSDSNTCIVEGKETCELFVPGAEQGVVDVVSASIVGGPARTISLVF